MRRKSYKEILRSLENLTALEVAERTTMGKEQGEKDGEFVKRIVAHYMWLAQYEPAHD